MNTALLVCAIALSALAVILFIFSWVYARSLAAELDTDLTDDRGELDPAKQIKHLKRVTAEFGIKYAELKLGKLLGKGSQGEVFKATWRGSAVAVKKVDTRKVPPEIIDELCAEANIMRRLRHPTLTLFMGVSLEHPHLCIVTEVVARGSLFDIIHDETGALTWAKCLGIGLDVARGLTYLHSHNPPILHRDLKSLNILVDDNWRGKVADFGMTRFQEDGGTMTQCGSPLWMAPEMIRNDPYDEKSDVYSFAICLWEMYTRKIPYRELGLAPSHLVVKVVKEHLRPPIPKQCPRAYKHLMERCWNPVAEKRPTFPQILKIMEGFMQDPAILNHKPMSSRDSTIIVRPERIEPDSDVALAGAGGGALGALGNVLGMAASGSEWKLESKDVAFYNEAGASFRDDLVASGALDLASGASTGGARPKSMQNLNLALASPSGGGGGDAVTARSVQPVIASATATTSSSKPASGRSTPSADQSPLSGPRLAEGTPAPLALNAAVKATKDAKNDDASSGAVQLASQGGGVMLGRFRGKVVAVKPCYLSRQHLVLSNEERVAADLDGRLQDTKVGAFMKRVAALRHPNITLFMGAFVDGVENLRQKLKDSGQLVGSALDSTAPSSSPTTTPAAASSSSSSSSVPTSSGVRLSAPPPGCDYYLGLVQEFMPRGTLHDILCDASLVVDWDTMLGLLIDAASGMAFLHGTQPAPVVHQALTSHRLLVDKNWRVKVHEYAFVDLQAALGGLALPATPWSSPEYIKHPNLANVTMAGNVYSFGLIMWQALVRKPLFEGRPLDKALEQRIVKQGDRPSLPSSLGQDLRHLIEKTWMADPHARPSFTAILDELHRLKKLGPPKIVLKLGLNAHMYRKAKTVFAYRSKDAVTIMKDWGTNLGKKNSIIIFSGEDDVYLCDEEVFNSTYEKLEPGAGSSDEGLGGTPKVPDSPKTPGGFPMATLGGESRPGTAAARDPMNDHHEYRKTGTVLARCMEEAFSVKTNGGTEHGTAGDYLVQNEQGDQWSIEAKTFVELYERSS